jgi:hypothetical protein
MMCEAKQVMWSWPELDVITMAEAREHRKLYAVPEYFNQRLLRPARLLAIVYTYHLPRALSAQHVFHIVNTETVSS